MDTDDGTTTTSSSKRKYSEEFKSLVLEASMSNSVADTAKQFNIPPSTVRSWQKQDPGFEGIGSPDPSPPAKKYSDEFINTVLKYIEVKMSIASTI